MSPEEETRRLLAELERCYGRGTVIRFLKWWLSRQVVEAPARQRGYTDARFTPHAPDCQTRRR